MLGGGARAAGSSAETAGIVLAVFVALMNLGVLPGLTGLTLGKWATGLRIERSDGGKWNRSRIVTSLHWLSLSFALLGIGFLIAAVTVHGRGLHDMIAALLSFVRVHSS